ncbi:hypothetical protein GCM10018793_45420 [Streptomyces sulfonofaciens]|uniref:DUF1876 domain-containing protein n=1 Tax=Streptomyces sulfonofaciens TaxID=68272 RepID=A0A919GEZ6_9ACTN|nr:DUF1876 domain-containing protein [Streptomyces sulfonofaciens]GHH83408.1 hypothetical protein GCM10018793_45420 [Streptomyces sulfonofaciens]
MTHTTEWKVHLHLFEDEGTTKARAVVDTGTTSVVGNGLARCNPGDRDVPEIGDELAAGRAMRDIAQQLLGTAQRDIESVNAPSQQGSGAPWPM